MDRCLVEGGGNVAFVKHTTVMENCDGKRKEWWARNQLTTGVNVFKTFVASSLTSQKGFEPGEASRGRAREQ